MFYVYILHSKTDSNFYIGLTHDLRRRISEHKRGKVTSTKNRLPVSLIFYEAYTNKKDACRREKYLKTSKGKQTLKSMLTDTLEKPNLY